MSTNNLAEEWDSNISKVFCVSSVVCFIGSLSSFDAGGRATGEQNRPAGYGSYPDDKFSGVLFLGPSTPSLFPQSLFF